MSLSALNNSAIAADYTAAQPSREPADYALPQQTALANSFSSSSTATTTTTTTTGPSGTNQRMRHGHQQVGDSDAHSDDNPSLLESCDWPSVMLSQYKGECHRLAVPYNASVLGSMRQLAFVIPSDAAATLNVDERRAGHGLQNRKNPNIGSRGSLKAAPNSNAPFGYAADMIDHHLGHPANLDEAARAHEDDGSSRVLCFAMSNASLGPRGAMALAAAFRGVPLTIISLSECFLEDEGCRVICQTIASDPLLSRTLRELDLRGNAIRSAGPAATALVACQNLQSLRMSWNKIGLLPAQSSALIAAARTHRGLVSLDLSNNALDQQVLLALAELVIAQVPQLTHIDLSWNLLASGAGGSALHGALIRNNSLLVLGVNGNGFTRQEVEAISDKLAANERMHWDAKLAADTQRLLATEGRRLQDRLQRETILRADAEAARDGFATEITLLSERLLSSRSHGDAVSKQLTADNAVLEAKMIEEKIEANAKVRDAEARSDDYRRRCDEATAAAQTLRIELEAKSRNYFQTNEDNKTLISSQQREVSQLKDQLSSVQAQLTHSTEDAKQCHQEIADRRLANVQLSTELAIAKEENLRRESENKARYAEIGMLEARVKDMATELATLKGQINALEADASKHKFDAFDAENKFKLEVQRARDEGDLRLKRLADDHAQALKVREAAYDALQQELNRQRDEAAVDRDRLAAQLQILATAETEKRKAVMDLQAAQQAVRRAESNEQLANEQYRHLQSELSAMHEEQQGRMDTLEQQLRRQYAPLEASLRSKDEVIRKLEREVQRLIAEGRAERDRQADVAAKLEAKLLSDFRATLHRAIEGSAPPLSMGTYGGGLLTAGDSSPVSVPSLNDPQVISSVHVSNVKSPYLANTDQTNRTRVAPSYVNANTSPNDGMVSSPNSLSDLAGPKRVEVLQQQQPIPSATLKEEPRPFPSATSALATVTPLSVPSIAPVALRGPLSAAAASADKAPAAYTSGRPHVSSAVPSTLPAKSVAPLQVAPLPTRPSEVEAIEVSPVARPSTSSKPPLPMPKALAAGPQRAALPSVVAPAPEPEEPESEEGYEEEEYGDEEEEEEEAAGAASLAESPSIEPLSAQLSSTAPLVAHVDPSVGAKPQSPILSPATYTSSGEQAALAHSRCNSSDSSSAIPSRLKRDSDDDRDDDFEQSSDASDF